MQGDIFQLESLTGQVAVPKPQPASGATSTRPQSGPQVSIYNEDDLSHLLFVSSNPHHHHHHHHHHHTHEQRPFVHPADNGTVLINAVMDDVEYNTPALSDCESCSGSESGMDIEGPVTPPLEELDSAGASLEAYRRKGRRNALSVDYEFPVFLGRQDEEWQEPLEPTPLDLTSPAVPVMKKAEAVEEIPASRHVDAIEGPLMSWWPEPLDTMKNDWAVENLQWELEIEKEKLREREREGGIASTPKHYDADYSTRHVANIEGRMMSWWPAPLDTLEYEWSERFYE
ncbi:hypothetical protein F4859DRAFT_469151 [Xylaria cf. heliscus]|nr:hypothetical protein F4859DRAFT_469151 [Xylaria cf. heliscus]